MFGFFNPPVKGPLGFTNIAVITLIALELVHNSRFVQFVSFVLWSNELAFDFVARFGVDTDPQLVDLSADGLHDATNIADGDMSFGWDLGLSSRVRNCLLVFLDLPSPLLGSRDAEDFFQVFQFLFIGAIGGSECVGSVSESVYTS